MIREYKEELDFNPLTNADHVSYNPPSLPLLFSPPPPPPPSIGAKQAAVKEERVRDVDLANNPVGSSYRWLGNTKKSWILIH